MVAFQLILRFCWGILHKSVQKSELWPVPGINPWIWVRSFTVPGYPHSFNSFWPQNCIIHKGTAFYCVHETCLFVPMKNFCVENFVLYNFFLIQHDDVFFLDQELQFTGVNFLVFASVPFYFKWVKESEIEFINLLMKGSDSSQIYTWSVLEITWANFNSKNAGRPHFFLN